jgi:hypothetical protein
MGAAACLADFNPGRFDRAWSFPALPHITWYSSFVWDTQIGANLRSAWKVFRLDAIRSVVQQTIADLEALPDREVMGRDPLRSEIERETSSLRAALDACCDELREGCGLPMSSEPSVHAHRIHAADADWTESFSTALEVYRSAACKELDASLAALALPPETPSALEAF